MSEEKTSENKLTDSDKTPEPNASPTDTLTTVAGAAKTGGVQGIGKARAEKLTLGRTVLYRMPSGQQRPAVVVAVHSDACCNLQVFTDGANDGAAYAQGIYWATSCSLGAAPGTWAWPTRV